MLKFSFQIIMGCVICLFGISHSLTRPQTPTVTNPTFDGTHISFTVGNTDGDEYHAVLLTDLTAALQVSYESGSQSVPLEGACVSYSIKKGTSATETMSLTIGDQTVERYFIGVAASKKDSNGVKVYSGWRVYTDANGVPISLTTSHTDKKETVFYRARRISEHNDSLVVIDFKFSLPVASASGYSLTIRRDATPIVTFPNLASIADTFSNISSAITNSASIANNLVIMRESNGFYLYNIYTILSDYGKNPDDRLNGQLIKNTGEVDTAIAHIGIYGDSSYQNMISTVYDLLRVEGTVSNPIYPGVLQALPGTDTLKAKLLITAMLDLSLPHNSPAPNSNEAAGGIFTNYIQCMDNIVRNWSTIRSGGIGLPRLRNIHANILATNKDSVIIDPIYVKNYGTLAEYGQVKEAQKRKNYAFYEGYSRLNVDLAVRPSGSLAVPTASGLMFRISPNIQLYEANLADTFNMFDTAFISGGPSSRRIIIPSNDSLLLKFQTDGIWLKGDSTNSSEKNYYCGMEAVRLKMQSGVDSIGVPFVTTNEKDVLGDAVGVIVGDAEKNILMISNVFFDGSREDTLKATNNVRTAFKGNKRKIEYEGKYKQAKSFIIFFVSSDSVNGPCRVIERGNRHIVIENISTYNSSTVVACETLQGKVNRVFIADLSSSNLLFKDIYNGFEQAENKGADPITLALEKDPDAWIPVEKRNNAFIVLSWSQGIRVYSCRNDTDCLVLPRNKLEEVNCFALFGNWATFESELLGLVTDSLYLYMPNYKDGFFRANYGDKSFMDPEDLKKFELSKMDPTNSKSHKIQYSIDAAKIGMVINEKNRVFNDVVKNRPDNKGPRNGYDNKNYLMLFHSPGNDNGITIQLNPLTTAPKFNYQVYLRNGSPVFDVKEIGNGSGIIEENLTIFEDIESDFEIRFGVDTNRKNKITDDDIELWNGCKYRIFAVTEMEYQNAKSLINKALFPLYPMQKIGYQLTYRFVNGYFNNNRDADYIPNITGASRSVKFSDGSLTHRFGYSPANVRFVGGQYEADVPIFEYVKNSKGSEFFAMQKDVLPAAQLLYDAVSFDDIYSNFVTDGDLITLHNKELKQGPKKTINFDAKTYGIGNCVPIGDITFEAYRISNTEYVIQNFSIFMKVEDLWDFDFFNKQAANIPVPGTKTNVICFPEQAAMVQCGNNVCGNTVGDVIYVDLTFERAFTFAPRSVHWQLID
jgi:hypothetical protein